MKRTTQEILWSIIMFVCLLVAVLIITGCTIVKEKAGDERALHNDVYIITSDGTVVETSSGINRNQEEEGSERGTDGEALGDALGAAVP